MERKRITLSLIAVNVAVFLLVFSMPEEMMNAAFEVLSFSGPTSSQAWRWFTSLFMHASASHLFFNMLGLFFFGKILENEVTGKWFLSIYFAAGLLGNLVFMFTSTSPVIGASGAMFGIMGAAMLLNPVKRVYVFLFPLPLGIVAITFTIVETLIVYFQPQEFSNIANVSHVAGIITGSVFAMFFNPKRSVKGILVLVLSLVLIIVLGPIFGLITGIGALILQGVDWVIGIFLYNIASLLGFLWI